MAWLFRRKSPPLLAQNILTMSYLSRMADTTLAERMEVFGAVLIEGPKWCGKTTTAEQVARSVIKLQDADMRNEYLATAASKPSLLLRGGGQPQTDRRVAGCTCRMGRSAHGGGQQARAGSLYPHRLERCEERQNTAFGQRTHLPYEYVADEPVGVAGVQREDFPQAIV